jgi:hypothetical protein
MLGKLLHQYMSQWQIIFLLILARLNSPHLVEQLASNLLKRKINTYDAERFNSSLRALFQAPRAPPPRAALSLLELADPALSDPKTGLSR